MSESVSIPSRFNGPRASGQGGYSAGVLAGLLGGGAAEVSLRAPVPLDKPLDIERAGDGSLRIVDGELLVAEGTAAELDLEPPAAVGIAEARAASARYRGLPDGEFACCFVCGRARDDAFGVFAGQVGDRDVVASPWTPPEWTADDDGRVRPEFVWAVLDCPTFFAVHLGAELTMSVLARMTARVDQAPAAGEEHAVMSWPLAVDGRKRLAGAAVLTGDGTPLAIAQALMIEPRAA